MLCRLMAGLANQRLLARSAQTPASPLHMQVRSPTARSAPCTHGKPPKKAAIASGPTPAGPCEPVWPAEQPPEHSAAWPGAAPGSLPSLPVWLLHSSWQAWRSSMWHACLLQHSLKAWLQCLCRSTAKVVAGPGFACTIRSQHGCSAKMSSLHLTQSWARNSRSTSCAAQNAEHHSTARHAPAPQSAYDGLCYLGHQPVLYAEHCRSTG